MGVFPLGFVIGAPRVFLESRVEMPKWALEELPYASLRAFCAALGRGSEGARAVALDGVLAAVVPASPERSVINSVMYESAEALEPALARLGEIYEEAGVGAWTVWAPERDGVASAILERAGHRLDALPTAMAMELGGFDRQPSTRVEIDTEPDPVELGRINDRAYGFDGDDFARALTRRPPGLHAYVARVDGVPAACVGALDQEDDCGIFFVATLPEARGRGLATELMTRALADGRGRGCHTTSLQATEAGYPIYARLGYRDCGKLQMWERRA
jgi:GNAT superfamily N-acetyltransferase